MTDWQPRTEPLSVRRSRWHGYATAAIFLGALLANLRAYGTSPIAWSDTLNDATPIRQCVVNNECTLTGTGTSVPGFFHAVGWFELRSLLAWLGFDLDG